MNNNMEILHLLINKFDINIIENFSFIEGDELKIAVQNNNVELVDYLLSVPNINYTCNDNSLLTKCTILHRSVLNGKLEIVKRLCSLSYIDINAKFIYEEKTALHIAIEKYKWDIVKYLLNLPNIDVNSFEITKYVTKYNEKTALQLAVEKIILRLSNCC